MTPFAELVAATNFSFLRGASHPQEMVEQAAALGLAAIGIADRNTLAGVVRAHRGGQGAQDPAAGRRAARHHRRLRGGLLSDRPRGLRPAVPPAHRGQPPRHEGPVPFLLRGDDRRQRRPDPHRPAAAADHAGFRRAPRHARRPPRAAASISAPPSPTRRRAPAPRRARRARAARRARRSSPPTTRIYHHPGRSRSPTCSPASARSARSREAGYRLEANAERHLKPRAEMARLFARYPAGRRPHAGDRRAHHASSLDELRYEYPDEPVPPGKTPQAYLEELTWAARRPALSRRRARQGARAPRSRSWR